MTPIVPPVNINAYVKVVENILSSQGIEVNDKIDDPSHVQLLLSGAMKNEKELAKYVLKGLVKAACKSDKGTARLDGGDLCVDSTVELSLRSFSDVVSVRSFDFSELAEENPTIGKVAEAVYLRHMRKKIEPKAYAIENFPKCLRQGSVTRFDICIGGFVVFTLSALSNTQERLRLFKKGIDGVFGRMVESSFASTVLPPKWSSLKEREPGEVVDLLEDVQLAISDFWEDSPQSTQIKFQVEFLFTALANDLCAYFRGKAAECGGLFQGDRTILTQALNCFDSWISSCTKMTAISWGSTWGGRFRDEGIENVHKRLSTISEFRDLMDEISFLLSEQDLESLKVDSLWTAFTNVDVFDASAEGERQWGIALGVFDRRFSPIEYRCVTALHDLFSSQGNLSAQMTLQEFMKYRQLMKRPQISKELMSERDNLLAKLNERLQSIRLEFEHRSERTEDEAILEEEDKRCQAGRFMPSVANNVIWLRQLRGRVEQMISICSSLLSDLSNSEDFKEAATTLLEEITDYEQETFNNWSMDIEDQQHELMLDASKPLMTIDQDGHVQVNYSERLVQLLKEVRIFSSLGFRMSEKTQSMVRQGLAFYRNGLALKQIANAYNSMTADIIPCTQAMLLEPAIRFEKVISASGTRKLAWNNTEDSARFIETLRVASQSLSNANHRLRKIHKEILDIVAELFDIDMLRQRSRWMGKVRTIREKVETSSFKNMNEWKIFLDMQIYKAMEHQYQYGLESLHETITEIKADVVFDLETGTAALRPSFERIREQYYLRIKDFITLPIRFQGCHETAGIFKYMISRNESGICTVMQNAAQLFKKLKHELKRFAPLVIIGQCGRYGNPPLESIVEKSLSEVQHWEQSIRLLKQKGKEINAEELFIKIGCITLCTASIKSTAEEHLYRLTDALQVTLRNSAKKHLENVDLYLGKVEKYLESKLTKLDQIDEANILHLQLVEQRPAVEVEFHHFYNKNVLLQSMTGSNTGLDFTTTKDRWGASINRLDTHEKEVEAQLNALRDSVAETVKAWEKDIERFANLWNEVKPKDSKTPNALKIIQGKQEEFKQLKERGEECEKQCRYFQMDDLDTHMLQDMEKELEENAQLWQLLDEFQKELNRFKGEIWIAFRAKTYHFEDFLKLWQDKLKDAPASPINVQIRTELDSWSRSTPLLKFVRGNGFTPGHWSELFSLLKLRNVTQDSLTFGEILNHFDDITRQEAALRSLFSRAQGEAQIREALDDVKSWGGESKFTLTPHPDRPGVMLITDWKDTQSTLSDNQALLLSMKESPYFSIFADDANRWEERLSLLDEYLRNMSLIQRKWVYLEPIFRRGALPNEQDRFLRIDKEYLQIMKGVQADSHLIALANHKEYKTILPNVLEQLERCQKSLNQYLEKKRDSFPRFYFISDDDLLEILAQSKNPVVIQSHLKKLFAGIHNVGFDSQKENIIRMLSLEGEVVPLEKPVRITEEVENWLSELDKEMRETLKMHLVRCVENLDIGLYSSQILCTAEMVNFTKKTEVAIKEGRLESLRKHKANLQAQLRELTVFAGSNSDKLVSLKLKALIMDFIHNIEVVDALIDNSVDKESDWLWNKQLRYYIANNDICVLRMVDAEFKYSYEYQGNAPKLVHTPLTDCCYLTLTQGMRLGYGGNPYGPAGTGKTESVKALGNAMGRQVLVFNCDEGIDFKSMGRIFTGLVKCGAWGCFDEFNRLKVDQLSAVSQMIQIIQEALKNGDEYCHLLGREVDVNPNAGIFVTLNPAGKGYGGRSKLPDNLKMLFRSIAMSAPDNKLIIETILFSEGFENAKDLAVKMVEVFKLSEQLLSYQKHYDWGLRAMKAVLRLGGTLIHDFLMKRVADGQKFSPEDILMRESEILIKSLRVNTLSKLTLPDCIIFNSIISDVFLNVPLLEIDYDELRTAVEESIKDLKLQLLKTQVDKVLQLYEALRQRMGVVIVGPSGSGKSTLQRILRKALQRLGKTVPLYIMNPKAMPRNLLLGHMDPNTREWFDGVLTEAAKKVVKEETTVESWIFCDGDIDPEWVESLNSVLDDNKLLTMPNGVRIQFGDNVHFLFETHSLEYASPATVSRMGIIYLSEEDVKPKIAVTSWLNEQPDEIRSQLSSWIESYFYEAIEALVATDRLIVETTKTGLVMSGLSQLHGCRTKSQFALGLIYGLGSYLPEEPRKDYAKYILSLTSERAPDMKNPLDFKYNEDSGSFSSFEFESPLDLTVEDLHRTPMIAAVECQRYIEVMKQWSKPIKPGVYRPFILVGPEGCGKTMLLHNLFSHSSNTCVATVNCSSQTEGIHVIQKLKQMCQLFNSNQGKVLRPKEAERLVLLLKDLNLPKPDKYGTVQLHSLLQQLILYNGFYDNDLEWVTVERLQIVGSMNPPGSIGRFPVTMRLLAIVSVLSISYPSRESLQLIYSEFFNIMMKSQKLQLNIPGKGPSDVARMMTTIYEVIASHCTPDVASHYIFNPRDITKWALNLLNYNAKEIGEALAYEGRRIFVDRLVTPEEKQKLSKVIKDNLTFLVGHKSPIQEGDVTCFVSWLDSAATHRKLSTANLDELKQSMEQSLRNYSREYSELNVQLIPEVCFWIARVDRVLSQERGNLLLIGRSGVCGSEIVRLVAYTNRIEVLTLGITRDYAVNHFNAEMKSAMMRAGVEGQPIVLLLEDHHFFNAHFLETINSLLASGEVPGLFTHEEVDAAIAPLREDAIQEGMTPYNYFVDRIARFLHVCIIMDPSNPNYEQRCRSNPSLFTRCNVYWLGTWNTDSLKLIPRLMMKDVFRALDSRDTKKDFSLTSELVHIHRNFGNRFSPQHFKVFCQTYEHIYLMKSTQIANGLKRLQTGVSKLDEAQENVDKIAFDVSEKKKLLEVKQKEADEALLEIQAKMEEAGEQKKSIHRIQSELSKEQAVIEEKKTVIEQNLSGIQPVLDSALTAVSSIKADHLSELKALKQPPAAVQDVMEAVVLLIEGGSSSNANWAAIRKVLAGDIKGQILNFNLDGVSSELRNSVQKFITTKANSFKREVISRASKAAAPMCEWLKAVLEYSKVLESVAPMRLELRTYEENLSKGQEKKEKYEGKLKKVETKVEELKKKFAAKTSEAERLKDMLEHAEALYTNANELLSKLSSEHTRWSTQAKNITSELQLLPKRCLLSAAFITYLGDEAEDYRRKTIEEWKQTEKLPDFIFFSFLRDESIQLQYKAQGLPDDELSMDNAVMMHEQVYTPLLVDPSGQATSWLKNYLTDQKVAVDTCSISDKRLVSALELALRFGKKFIITDVDHIEPFMYPIIRKELRNEGTKRVIQIGDRRTVDYGEGFQLFLVTRATDLIVPPDILSYLTPISFSITLSGLEGQFLGITIQHEQPELEKQKHELLQKEEELKLKLAKLEESLLDDLANSKGSLLDNTTLIDSLNQIKTQANEITEALSKSKDLQKELDEKRNVYRPFASTASRTFFLTKNLKVLSHMYQFSFDFFMNLFRQTLKNHANDRTDTDTKIVSLRKTFLQLLVSSISRALLKEHRVTFGIHLAHALFTEECSTSEWEFLLDKLIAPENKRSEIRVPSFVLSDGIEMYRSLAACFPELVAKLNMNEADVWLQWMRTATPESDYPACMKKITPFQRLLVIKSLRNDRFIAAMNKVACELLCVESLGDNFMLTTIADVTECSTPVLLITTSGADPSLELQAVAHDKVGKSRFHQVAMGGGQTDEAIRQLRLAAENGDWLFLKNLHLVIPWVHTLQKELNVLKLHPEFRLFLTSEPSDEFPCILLLNCLKISFESPPGIKQNLVRTYKKWNKDFVESKNAKQAQLMFAAASLHAVVQERRSYIPQGWSRMYEFTASDLNSAADIVLQQSNDEIDWKAIKGLFSGAIYGGKMETNYDIRILNTYIDKFFSPDCLASSKSQRALFEKVKLPGTGKFSDYVKLIKSLPDTDVPMLFSLPPNADRVVQISRVKDLIYDLQRITEAKEESVMTREEWANLLNPILNSWSELVEPHSHLLTHSLSTGKSIKPVEGFIFSELATALKLLSIVNATLSDLRKVVDGSALLTEVLKEDASKLVVGEIPAQWDRDFSGPPRILPWLQSLLKRAVMLFKWQSLVADGTFLKSSLNLSYLMRPQTFLNALRQETAHHMNEPLVNLQLVSNIASPPSTAPFSVCLEGLLLQGAILDSDRTLQPIIMADQGAFSPFPNVYVGWTSTPMEVKHPVSIPVYSNSLKEHYLCSFMIPCESEEAIQEFVLAGVALVLEQ